MTSLPLFGPRTEPCAVLVADPPWQPRDTLPGERGAAHKYQTMNVDELGALELHLPPRAERHVLLFWRLSSMVPEALAVLDAWGYLPASELVWVKLRPCRTCCATGRVERWRFGEQGLFVPAPPGARAAVSCPDCNGLGGTQHLGLGHYVRAAHEVAIIARPKKGRAPDRLDLGVPSVLAAPMLLDVDDLLGEGRGKLVHSAKPDAFYALIERLYPGPRTELFSRRARPGWQVATSNQPDRLDEVARVMRDVWPAREREERLAAARRRAAR